MAEQALQVAREAKSLQQGLKESLKTHDPWDRDVEFQRKNLRRHYLRLLLVHPSAKESKDAETHLWMQTSYAFISIYKTRLAALDRALQSAPRPQQQGPRQGGHGPVEYRRLLQRFRQFLAEEERFWSQLVLRLYRCFGLTEARTALVELNILSAANDNAEHDNSGGRPEATNNGSAGRNQYQFPPEEASAAAAPQTPAERANRLAILTKALVCLGDIARYRELYNEAGGRPKAGHDETVPARKNTRGRRGDNAATQIPRSRNFDKAQHCYERARYLDPEDGNPSHQLAILACNHRDSFGSLYHYYRAMCVRVPYDTALENLEMVLNKALEQWRSRRKTEEVPTTTMVPRERVLAFKDSVVVLHALWRLRIDKMDSISPKHSELTRDEFASLVSGRVVPDELIWKVIVLAQGALWKHRMIRENHGSTYKNSATPQSSTPSSAVETRILTHLLGLHSALLNIGIVQLAESPPADAAANDLAQQITATFRRTLPALRIASKWLRANFKYFIQSQARKSKAEVKSGSIALAADDVSAFWRAYSQFSNTLSRLFPAERLPSMNVPLEEDIEMRGFLPLRRLMMGEAHDDVGAQRCKPVEPAPQQGRDRVHPNEEQLMRIADLLSDARLLAAMEDAPSVLRKNILGVGVLEGSGSPDNDLPLADGPDESGQSQEEDALTEATSHDDPVGDAFRKALSGSDGDLEEDEIVWDPAPRPLSPVTSIHSPALPSPPLHKSPTISSRANFSPTLTVVHSPTSTMANHTRRRSSLSPTLAPAGTTAQDLLNTVMGVPWAATGVDATRAYRQTSSTSQPPPFLVHGSSITAGHSIWSPSQDDESLKFQGVGAASGTQVGQPYPTSPKQYPSSPLHGQPQSIWASPPLNATSETQKFRSSTSAIEDQRQAMLSATNSTQYSPNASLDTSAYFTAPRVAQHAAGQPNYSPLYNDPAILSSPTLSAGSPYSHQYHHNPRAMQPYSSPLWGSTG